MYTSMLTNVIKEKRYQIVEYAKELLGISYEFGAEWANVEEKPLLLDCSELVEGVYKKAGLFLPDGSQSQYNFTRLSQILEPGDLAFFGSNKDPALIYHVGIVVSKDSILEARALDKAASFETGKVILRPIEKWKAYKNFCGFRCHPALVL